ncbi:MAG: STAS domain-containing protein [Fibrobacterota bacterium]
MDIQKKEYCGYVIFELRGEVSDPGVLSKVERSIEKELKVGDQHLAIDLRLCDYINSGLIGFFLSWKKRQDEKGLKFCLIEPSEKAMEVLILCGIPQMVTVYKNDVEFQKSA